MFLESEVKKRTSHLLFFIGAVFVLIFDHIESFHL